MRVSRTKATILLLAGLALPGERLALAVDGTEAPSPLRFGVMVEKPAQPDRIIRAFEGLLSLLRQELGPSGLRVGEVVIAADVEDLSRRLQDGEVDLVMEKGTEVMLFELKASKAPKPSRGFFELVADMKPRDDVR